MKSLKNRVVRISNLLDQLIRIEYPLCISLRVWEVYHKMARSPLLSELLNGKGKVKQMKLKPNWDSEIAVSKTEWYVTEQRGTGCLRWSGQRMFPCRWHWRWGWMDKEEAEEKQGRGSQRKNRSGPSGEGRKSDMDPWGFSSGRRSWGMVSDEQRK